MPCCCPACAITLPRYGHQTFSKTLLCDIHLLHTDVIEACKRILQIALPTSGRDKSMAFHASQVVKTQNINTAFATWPLHFNQCGDICLSLKLHEFIHQLIHQAAALRWDFLRQLREVLKLQT